MDLQRINNGARDAAWLALRHLNTTLTQFCFTLGVVSLTALLAAPAARADVSLNSLFSDGVVLQRGVELPVWGTAEDGERVTVEFAGQTVSTVAGNGKWEVRLKPLSANATSQILTARGKNTVQVNNVLVGEVWLCSGQSNMERQLGPRSGQPLIDNWQQEVAAAKYPMIRQFSGPRNANVTPSSDVHWKWVVCSPETVADFSAVGYFFGRDLFEKLDVPIGLLFSAWGGTTAEAWTSRASLEADPDLRELTAGLDRATRGYQTRLAKYKAEEPDALKKWQTENEAASKENKPAPRKPAAPADPALSPRTPTALYGGMIVPLQPYAMRGVIWYQGESDSGAGKRYQKIFPAMIAGWRQAWGIGQFPFLYVQIAPYDGGTKPENDPEIREAQLLTLKNTPEVAMVVITDVGVANNIHPPHKQPVGARLALAARALAYGEKVEYSGPLLDRMEIKGSQAIIHFTHAGAGLTAKDGELKGFTIAGADKNFLPAKAEVHGDTVAVSSDQVLMPVAVRFGWAKAPETNLFNREGLPASPFRTDTD